MALLFEHLTRNMVSPDAATPDNGVGLLFVGLLVFALIVYFASIGLGQIFVWLVAVKPEWFGGD